MTQFVESCVETAADGAKEAARQGRGRPQAAKLLKVLRDKKRILVTCHRHPDPDALGAGLSLAHLLARMLPEAPFRLIGIGLSDLTEAREPAAPTLFDQETAARRRAEAATDTIRARFGADAIIRGRSLR